VPDELDPASPASVEGLGYRDAMEELDRIVDELDGPAVDIDVVGERFARAVDLVDELDRRITATRARVNELAPRLGRLTEDGARPGSEGP